MSTLKQIEANRLNAQKSTGPRSAEGSGVGDRLLSPAKSALKSGLDAESQFVIGESREEFAQLQTEHYHHHKPRNPEERFQVDSLIRNEWFLRRFFRVEAHLWEYHTTLAERGTGVELGEAFTKASPIFMRLERRIRAAEKAHKEAKAELERLQQLPQPKETTSQIDKLGSFLTHPESDAISDLEIARMDLLLREKLAKSGIVDPSAL
jgi:hypothetical protein